MTKPIDILKLDPDAYLQAAELMNDDDSLLCVLLDMLGPLGYVYYEALDADVFGNTSFLISDEEYTEIRIWQCLHMAEFIKAAQEER